MTTGTSRGGTSGGVSFDTGSGTSGTSLFSGGVFSQGTGSSTGGTGSGFTGGATGRTGGVAGQGATGVPSSSNPFGKTYLNPMAVGVAKQGFGQPLFATVATTAINQANAGTTNGSGGFSTLGYVRAPAYITTVSADLPMVNHAPAQLRTNVTQALADSTRLRSGQGIGVAMDGGTVVLHGKVQDERERRFAESLVRLTPGVRDVRNELQVLVSASPGAKQ
jgi:hypothetical protein